MMAVMFVMNVITNQQSKIINQQSQHSALEKNA